MSDTENVALDISVVIDFIVLGLDIAEGESSQLQDPKSYLASEVN